MWHACLAGVIVLLGSIHAASSQDYPSKPIRIITGTAGGGSDITARILAQAISGPLGQSVVIDNRAGILAADAVAKAPPDGYTLTVNGASLWIGPLLQKAPYDAVHDFSPISLLVREVNVLVVHPSVPARSVKELIALARARPGALNYSSGGIGGPNHLGSELFRSMARINILHVPYKGGAPAIAALVTGEVQLTVNVPSSVSQYVKSGRLRALAVTSAQPSALVPGLPTVAESGLPGYEFAGMGVIFAPAKTPRAVISQLSAEIIRALKLPDVKQRFFNLGVEVVASTPEQLAEIIRSDLVKWSKVIQEAGLRAN